MLRLSKLADYGTVVMVYLAKNPNRLCNAREIADQTHLAMPTVSKLLKRLINAGLLVSIRGVAGGYKLKQAATAISVSAILAAFEGRKGLVACLHETCSLQNYCHVQTNWHLISQAIQHALDGVSLAVLAQPRLGPDQIKRFEQLAVGV